MSLTLVSRSPRQTQYLGSLIGRLAAAGDVYLLAGNLGTGKTTLTQGIAAGLGVKEYTSSPSFVIVREYQGRLPLYHMDFYRLDRVEEVSSLGLDDYLYGHGVCVIEWAEKGLPELPADNLLVRLEYLSRTRRSIGIEPRGRRYEDLLSQLETELARDSGMKWNWQ